jgi:uncharacterized lipoprotein
LRLRCRNYASRFLQVNFNQDFSVNRISPVRYSVATLLAATLLGGCSWFHHKENYYSKAAETRPLEVPPDLDTPLTSNELVVPAPNAGAATSAPGTSPPAGVVASTPVNSSTVSSGSGLRVADSADHTWQRVGLALERAQVGTISARDPGAHSYTVEVAGLTAAAATPAPAEEHHWYSRILHPFGGGSSGAKSSTSAVSGNVVVKVTADGDAARVDVEAAGTDGTSAEAARRVLAVLRDRLS